MSYYTPEHIVSYIVASTLDPLVKEAQDKVKLLKPQVEAVISKWEKLKEQKRSKEPLEKYDREMSKERERLLEPYLSLKVLDPAMGSGHFLTRATDFLAEAIATDPCVESPGSLADGSDLVYYRRRVVESCIYGVDFNPLAVELAKLTLWLATMAKSKPLSFLNHHLRTGNSLIGARVSDLDEIPKAKKKKGRPFDLGRAPVQLGIFMQVFTKELHSLLQKRALIAQLSTETLEDVHNKQIWEAEFQSNTERFRTLADVWVSTCFNNDVDWDQYNVLVENLQSSETTWEKLIEKKYVQKARKLKESNHVFHWELEFPEVFYDDNGNQKTYAGFDAVIGNPPYGSGLKDFEKDFCRNNFATARKLVDNYVLFTEKGLSLCRIGGRLSFIMPSGWLTAVDYQSFRGFILDNSLPELLVHLPYDVFPDAYIDTIVASFSKGTGRPMKNNADHLTKVKRFVIRENISTLTSATLHYEIVLIASWITDDLLRFDTKAGRPFAKVKEKLKSNKVKLGDLVDVDRGITPYRLVSKSHHSAAPGFGGRFDRYLLNPETSIWVQYDDTLAEYMPPRFSEGVRLVTRRIISRQFRLLSTLESTKLVFNKSFLICVANQQKYSMPFLCSLLNSRLLSKWFVELTEIAYRDDFPQIDIFTLKNIPIHRIIFGTQEDERKQLLNEGEESYCKYLECNDSNLVLALINSC